MMNFIQYAPQAFMATNATKEVDIVEHEMGWDLWIGSELYGTYEDFETAVRYAETEVPFTVEWRGDIITETRG